MDASADGRVNEERLISPIEVFNETKKRSDELHGWLKGHKAMFRDLDEAVQLAAIEVLNKFPRLVGEKRLRTSADPFVIALARVHSVKVVTDEKPIGNPSKPNIPDVCAGFDIPSIGICN